MAGRLQAFPRRLLAGVLPTRRLLAVDAGSLSVKLVLVEEILGRHRVLEQHLLEPADDGDDAREECLLRMRALLDRVGDCPVALALPHYRALSQVLDLSSTRPEDVQSAIEAESVKLSGLGESQIVHDFSRLTAFGKVQNPFWVTYCQEGEVQRQIDRCGLDDLDLCEVTTAANALVAAYGARSFAVVPTALVDVGAMGTQVTILHEGQPVYAASFAIGGETWVELLARAESCSVADARTRLCHEGFQGPIGEAVGPGLLRWQGELVRLLADGLRSPADLGLKAEAVTCVLAGGGAALPGLLERLSSLPGPRFVGWPQAEGEDPVSPRFAVAYGAALHALGQATHSASLLPDEVRLYWRRNHWFQVLQSLVGVALLLLVVALGVGTWQKNLLADENRSAYDKSMAALSAARTLADLGREVTEGYERAAPVLQRQRETVDVLATLALLQQARSNQSFWYVLFAKRRDYFLATPFPSTNAPAEVPVEPPAGWIPSQPGFVVELVVPELGEAGRRTVSRLVADLKATGRFQDVDSLPDERRRPLADPQVLVPGGHYALQLELTRNPFTLSVPMAGLSASAVGSAPSDEPVEGSLPTRTEAEEE